MNFAELEKINVTDRVEKKGRFSYLSWPFAVSEFRKNCPNGRWVINRSVDGNLPYMKTESGVFVSVTVWPDVSAESICFEQIHPVLNHQNKPISEPNSFDINTSIQRCLVKAIAIATGIGLYIYAGEDLPPDEKPAIKSPEEIENEYKEMVKAAGINVEDGVEYRNELAASAKLKPEDLAFRALQNKSEFIQALKMWIGERHQLGD